MVPVLLVFIRACLHLEMFWLNPLRHVGMQFRVVQSKHPFVEAVNMSTRRVQSCLCAVMAVVDLVSNLVQSVTHYHGVGGIG